jgi:hypothetical protein
MSMMKEVEPSTPALLNPQRWLDGKGPFAISTLEIPASRIQNPKLELRSGRWRSLGAALIRARTLIEQELPYRVCVRARDGRLYNTQDVLRLTDFIDGRVVLVDPATNPYWDEYQRYMRVTAEWYHKQYQRRLIWTYSWALTDPQLVRFAAVALGSRAVSLGAGTGYWERQLARCGVRVHAYDIDPPRAELHLGRRLPDWTVERGYGFPQRASWFPVRAGTPEMLRGYGGEYSLFLCYPPCDNDMAEQALRLFSGDTLVLVGGHAVATWAFFEQLEVWGELVAEQNIISVYRRRGPRRSQ